MHKIGIATLYGLSILLAGCSEKGPGQADPIVFEFSFETGSENWESFYSDYPVGEELFYELEFGHTGLPEPLDTTVRALKISGNNHSDDLLCAIVRKMNNLDPNTAYDVTFDVELASNAPKNAFGVGGSPDLSLGAGGISHPPANTVDEIDHYRPNFESRLQSGLSNQVFRVLGKIGVSEEIPTPFMLINRNNLEEPIVLSSNAEGELWLMIATDSGFESTTTLYYTSVRVILRKCRKCS